MIKRKCIIYTNLEEASSILGYTAPNSTEAATRLFNLGAREATVTNGEKLASSCSASGLVVLNPKKTFNRKVTGAGDAFLAAHFLSSVLNKELPQLEHLKRAERAARKIISHKER